MGVAFFWSVWSSVLLSVIGLGSVEVADSTKTVKVEIFKTPT